MRRSLVGFVAVILVFLTLASALVGCRDTDNPGTAILGHWDAGAMGDLYFRDDGAFLWRPSPASSSQGVWTVSGTMSTNFAVMLRLDFFDRDAGNFVLNFAPGGQSLEATDSSTGSTGTWHYVDEETF